MCAFRRMIGIVAASVIAGSTAAQERPPQAAQPPQRLRIHAPGTGLRDEVAPQRRQLGRRGGMGPGLGVYAPGHLLAQKEFLGLSEQQVQELTALDTVFAAQREKALETVRARQQDLRDAWNADDPDPQLVREKMKAAMDAQQEVELARIDAGAKAKGLLEAEQLGKVRGLAQGYRMGAGLRGGARGFPNGPDVRAPAGRGMMRRYWPSGPPRGRVPIR